MPHQTVLLVCDPIDILAGYDHPTRRYPQSHRSTRIRLTNGSRRGNSADDWEHRVPEEH